jgi:hypothetical protein
MMQRIVLGVVIGKKGKEDRIIDVASKYAVYEYTSENGNRLVSFAQMYDLIIVITKFQHKKIHRGTWVIPGTSDVNKRDHVLVNRRKMNTVTVVRSMKRPNCDSGLFLVRIISINKIINMQERYNKRTKWNRENLEDAILSQKFKHGMIRRAASVV